MAGHRFRLSRTPMVMIFCIIAVAAYHYGAPDSKAVESKEVAYYQDALNFIRSLSSRAGDLFDDDGQRQLVDSATRLQFSLNYWTQYPDPAIAAQAQRDSDRAFSQVCKMLDRSPQVERVWAAADTSQQKFVRRWPLGSGAVLLRIGRNGASSPGPRVLRAQFDLARAKDAVVNIGNVETTYAALFFTNAPQGETHVNIKLRDGSAEFGAAELVVTTPPTGTLRVSIVDGGGKPTPAAAGVFASNGEILTPPEAIQFDEGGFYYQSGRIRPHAQNHYWPGTPKEQRAFFIDREFTLRLPTGDYRLIASKGPEYLPVAETVSVQPGSETVRQVKLKRWIDMPARGWYAGDTHVHYARAGEAANRRLLEWTQAEDIRVASVLRMGDARETYFEQYGFGKEGRFSAGEFALVPGQEDPRTNVIGHTLQLNLQRPVRFPDRYYQYDLVFDDVHRQGGMTGYAHLYQPAGSAFFVRRDMALNIPARRVDFAEICEFGEIGDDLYYEFLNMGFPLTASAGSDVPWGNSIGTSRVYAYTGDRFSPDAWFAALKAGHTFVTTGAMLEFTVNGRIAGSEIEAKPGDVLHVKASASGQTVPPRYLEIVAQGDVVRSTKGGSLEFTLPVRDSMWIAARCSGAHTTPVYVKVNGRPFWKREQVGRLVERRLEALRELDKELSRDLVPTHQGNWDGPEAWRQGAAALRERIQIARQTYEKMRTDSR